MWNPQLGGIPADDMGLGKTLQALALMRHARDRDPGTGPFLVVAPTSVAPNWAAETARFAPGLSVDVVLDTLAKSGRVMKDSATADVVITTYTLFRLDAGAYNTVEWALLSLTAPGLFPSPQRFAEHYARPIDAAATSNCCPGCAGGSGRSSCAGRRSLSPPSFRPSWSRRWRSTSTPATASCMTPTCSASASGCRTCSRTSRRNRITILRSITRLRRLSLHPGLVDAAQDGVPCAKLDRTHRIGQTRQVMPGGCFRP